MSAPDLLFEPPRPTTCACCGAPSSIRRGRLVGRIRLGTVPKSMNEREGLMTHRQGWAVRKERDEIYRAIAVAAEQLAPATGPRIVSIEYVKSERSRKRDDPGNRGARSKAVLDGLVHAGLLIDDTEEFLVLPRERESKAAHGPQTIIEIHDIERQT